MDKQEADENKRSAKLRSTAKERKEEPYVNLDILLWRHEQYSNLTREARMNHAVNDSKFRSTMIEKG